MPFETYPDNPRLDDVECDWCDVVLTRDETWHRPAYFEVWLCGACAAKDLKTYDRPECCSEPHIARVDGSLTCLSC